MDATRAVLQKADAQLSMVGTLYGADLELQRVSPTLRGKIKGFLDSERAALDQLAARIVASVGAGEAHVHYPFAAEKSLFAESVGKNLPGVREARPDIVDVIARHQPFSVPALAQLRELLRDEARQRLTPETRPAPQVADPPPDEAAPDPVAPRPPPAGTGLTGGVFINGIEYDPVTLKRLNPEPEVKRETVYVDWQFEGSDTSALRTLEAVHAAVTTAIDEISAAAELA